MLIGKNQEAFNSKDYIYELKLDGFRCTAFLDKDSTDLRNKRDIKMLSKVPELTNIHKQAKYKCILDGELAVMENGKPNFYEMLRRAKMSDTFKIQLIASKLPASFTAFDILYYKDHCVMDLPLMQRKKLLEKVIKENENITISRYIEEYGIELYNMATENNLEGVVAKRKDSKYYLDKRTNDWIKIKNMLNDDFVICGYILKYNGGISITLGQFSNKEMIYKSHVTLGITSADLKIIKSIPETNMCPFNGFESDNDYIVWVEPILVCSVRFMMSTANGSLRQPVFKGLRNDKEAEDCIVN